MSEKDDGLVTVRPLFDRVDDVRELMTTAPRHELEYALEKGQSTGRPLTEEGALKELERKLGLRFVLPSVDDHQKMRRR